MILPIKQNAFRRTGFTQFGAGQHLLKPVQMLHATERGLYRKPQIANPGPDTFPGQFSNPFRVTVGTDDPDAILRLPVAYRSAPAHPGQDNFDNGVSHTRADSLHFT